MTLGVRIGLMITIVFGVSGAVIETLEAKLESANISHERALLGLSLDSNQLRVVTLAQEMEFVRGYLEIEQARFCGRLQFSVYPPEISVTPWPLCCSRACKPSTKQTVACGRLFGVHCSPMLRAYFIDDEELALERLGRMLAAMGRVGVTGLSPIPSERIRGGADPWPGPERLGAQAHHRCIAIPVILPDGRTRD
jgi:hypothetical protein